MTDFVLPVGVTLLALVSGLGFAAIRDAGLLTPTLALLSWKVAWLALCVTAVGARYRVGIAGVLRELGAGGPPKTGLALGAAASLPMLLVLATGAPTSSGVDGAFVLYTGAATPFAEEVLFRGYLLRQLYRRAGAPIWLALVVSAALFGVAHASAGVGPLSGAAHMLTVGIMGAILGVLFISSGENLWVPIGLHAGMNLWSALFDTAAAGSIWLGNLARLAALVAALVLQAVLSKRGQREGLPRHQRGCTGP